MSMRRSSPASRSRLPVTLLVLGASACGSADTTQPASPADTATTTASSSFETTSTIRTTSTIEEMSPVATASSTEPTSTIETTKPPDTTTSAPGPGATTDRADAYLGSSTEIYRRTLPDGQDFVARLSTEPYATVFGLTWTAPTGSAEECLGDHALFLGVPGDIGGWGSAWVATSWSDAAVPTQPAVLAGSMSAAEETVPATQFLLLRTAGDVAEIVLLDQDGSELDRAPVANDVGMVVVPPQAQRGGQTILLLRVVAVAGDGTRSAPLSVLPPPAAPSGPTDCGPGDAPQRPLPAAGAQPADPAAAAAQIRQRLALLVDPSRPAGQQLADLLDDDTGVAAAIAALDDSPYRDVAATATYAIDELVFTAQDEAWFRYTITTSASTYGDRFGTAVLERGRWRITRATVCQDLALAQSPCVPSSPAVEPPVTPEWQAAWQEWVSRAMLYTGNDGCGPLSQC